MDTHMNFGKIKKIREKDTTMELNGFKAQIMEAERLVGEDVFGLPPGSPLPVYKVSDFIEKAAGWIDEEGSYVVPVNPDKGLWFNWTANDERNTAVLPSVKGCNPITGQQIDGFGLESYQKKCPVHGTDLNEDLYCEKCGYKWAPQNYVCAPNTLWWDGFRDEDGTVRQFFFTEDMKRDVAAAMLGKENTVPAFGFAFYTAKEKRLSVKINDDGTFTSLTKGVRPPNTFGGFAGSWPKKKSLIQKWSPVHESDLMDKGFDYTVMYSAVTNTLGYAGDDIDCGLNQSTARGRGVEGITAGAPGVTTTLKNHSELKQEDSITMFRMQFSDEQTTFELTPKEVAVGAGAQIEQEIKRDTYEIESWKDTPDAVMRIYFVFEDEFNQYASHGFKGEHGSMLKDVTVG